MTILPSNCLRNFQLRKVTRDLTISRAGDIFFPTWLRMGDTWMV